MEVKPVKKARQPGYPRMDEVDPESIKMAMPRRWAASRDAKAALAALTVSAFAGCAPVLPEGFVDPGVPEPPIIPYCMAAGLALGIGIWIRHMVRKRKKHGEGSENVQAAEIEAEQEYDEGEY